MKKFFKFAAIALVATGMLFSCGKDEEDNNGENNNNQQQEEQIPEGVVVTFGHSTWTAASIDPAYNYQDALYMYAWSNEDQQTMPFMMVYAEALTAGTVTDSFDEEAFGYANDKIYSFDYYEDGMLYSVNSNTGETSYFGDWWAKTATIEVKSYDATSMAYVAKATAVMFDASEAYVDGAGMDAATTEDLSMTINTTLEAL